MLKCEIDTPQMGKKVLTAARKYFRQRKGLEAFFEHGQWFIRRETDSQDEPEETYSVNDAEGGDSVNGFCFEQL